VVRAARRRRIPVAVCGEMAADPALLTLLVGLGLREFSMAPTAIGVAKQVLRALDVGDARRAAGRALLAHTTAEVAEALGKVPVPGFGDDGVPAPHTRKETKHL